MKTAAENTQLEYVSDHWVGHFKAMASPCEVLVDTDSQSLAAELLAIVSQCAWRIERKFSRYRDDNIVHEINNSDGRPVTVDEETGQLLDFASTLYGLSDGLFDITSGVLSRAWHFDGSTQVPQPARISELLRLVGWSKVSWRSPVLTLQPGMQIDFGGFGKEYAVDQAIKRVRDITEISCLVSFGGDLAVSGVREHDRAWQVGIESAEKGAPSAYIQLFSGALATSGNTYQYVLHNGRRLGHILDPRTGWPIEGTPRCVTVAGDTCLQAGTFTTLAMLRGPDAEEFLGTEAQRYWVQR